MMEPKKDNGSQWDQEKVPMTGISASPSSLFLDLGTYDGMNRALAKEQKILKVSFPSLSKPATATLQRLVDSRKTWKLNLSKKSESA